MPRDELRSDSADNAHSDKLHAAVRGGTRAVLAAQIGSQLISLVVLGVLMRLVGPEAYGLLAMALPALMLPRMAATLGTGVATVQRQTLSSGQLSWLFWLTLLSGAIAAIVTAIVGPLLARSYAQPMLGPLCVALAGSTLIAALGTQHQALLERELKLAALSRLRLAAQMAGGMAGIVAAVRGMGVWSLVVQQYGELLMLSAGVWMLEPWRPGFPRAEKKGRGLLALSSAYSLSSLVVYVAQNLDKILFPLLLGQAATRTLGLYSQAFSLMMRPVYLVTVPLFTILLPALSRSLDDPPLYNALAAKFYRLAGVALFPCGLGLWAVGPDVMLVLGGEEWRAGGVLLSALAPVILVQGFFNLSAAVFASTDRAGRLLASSFVLLLLLAQGLVAGYFLGKHFAPAADLSSDGAIGPALGMAAAYSLVIVVVLFVPYHWFCFRSSGLSLVSVLRPLWPALRAALIMGVVVAVLRQLLVTQPSVPVAGRLAILVAAGVAAYSLLARRELHWFWQEMTTLGKAS